MAVKGPALFLIITNLAPAIRRFLLTDLWRVTSFVLHYIIPQHDSVRSYRIYSEEPDPEEPELGGDCVERRPKAGIASLGVCRP